MLNNFGLVRRVHRCFVAYVRMVARVFVLELISLRGCRLMFVLLSCFVESTRSPCLRLCLRHFQGQHMSLPARLLVQRSLLREVRPARTLQSSLTGILIGVCAACSLLRPREEPESFVLVGTNLAQGMARGKNFSAPRLEGV